MIGDFVETTHKMKNTASPMKSRKVLVLKILQQIFSGCSPVFERFSTKMNPAIFKPETGVIS